MSLWAKFVFTGKLCMYSILPACLVVVESRDMFARAAWDAHSEKNLGNTLQSLDLRTGDILFVCNRWMALPTWKHKMYSFWCKFAMRTSWDEVAVVICNEGEESRPRILFCDMESTHWLPLEKFLESRHPRGVAVQHLLHNTPQRSNVRLASMISSNNSSSVSSNKDSSDNKLELSPHVAELFMKEVAKITPEPWYVFKAARKDFDKAEHYEFCVKLNQQRIRIMEMVEKRNSRQAIRNQEENLKQLEEKRHSLAASIKQDNIFHLFNGSLVSSFLATYNILDRQLPAPSYYVAADFTHPLPLLGTYEYSTPQVFYKT